MSATFDTVLIAVVFAAQIAVLSFFTPRARRRNQALMFERYPFAEYPRLYPVPKEHMERRLALFAPVHFAIGLGAIAVLVAGALYADSAFTFARWMLYSLLAQILPLYINLPSAIKIARAFRAMPPPSVRSAELRQWRASDFVSPLWIGLGLASSTAALVCAPIAYLRAPNVLPLAVLAAVIGAAVLARMVYLLAGRVTLERVDPYMAQDDTFRSRRRRLRLLFGGGAVLCSYMAVLLLNSTGLLRFDIAHVIVAISIVFQLIGLAIVRGQRRDLRLRDFSVYRPSDGTQAAP